MSSDLDPGVQALVDALDELGFRIVKDEGTDNFNRLLELSHPERTAGGTVQLVNDRGIWGVDIEVDGRLESVWLLKLALDRAPLSHRALSHEERRELTLDALARLPDDDLPELRAELDRLRQESLAELGHTPRRNDDWSIDPRNPGVN